MSARDCVKNAPRIELIGVTGLPEINTGDMLGPLIVGAAVDQGSPVHTGDVVVVTQKIVSKAEDRLVRLDSVSPSAFALEFSTQAKRDPRLIELVLRESRSVVKADPVRGILIVETKHGLVCANAGIDSSNVPGEETVSLLPEDPDLSAKKIKESIFSHIWELSIYYQLFLLMLGLRN